MLSRREFLATATAGLATTLLFTSVGLTQRMPGLAEVQFDPDIPVLGNPHGDVTIVEYFDYQCGYCRSGHADLMRVVKSDGNIRLVLKDWIIFGEISAYASRLVLATEGRDDYEKAVEAIMQTRGQLNRGRIKDALSEAGLDPDKLEFAFKNNSARINDILSRNMDQGEAFNFAGTPAFVIGTRLYGGAMREPNLIEAVRLARKS